MYIYQRLLEITSRIDVKIGKGNYGWLINRKSKENRYVDMKSSVLSVIRVVNMYMKWKNLSKEKEEEMEMSRRKDLIEATKKYLYWLYRRNKDKRIADLVVVLGEVTRGDHLMVNEALTSGIPIIGRGGLSSILGYTYYVSGVGNMIWDIFIVTIMRGV